MAEIFNLHNAASSDFTSLTVGASQALAYNAGAGLGGTTGGMRLTIGGTANVYAAKTFTALTSTAATFRFYLNDLVALTMASLNSHFIYTIHTASATSGWLEYKDTAGVRTIQMFHKNDAGSTSNTAAYTIDSGTTYIQLKYEKSSVDTATDAAFSLYFNDTLKERKTGLEIYNTFAYNQIRIGNFDTVDSGTSGTWDFDEVVGRDDGTLPGSTASPPTVTDISNQTGTFGTQKTVACTIADTDSDIVRCDVSTDGTTLITLTASGAASITDNGTTAPYVAGTHTDVVATLGNGIKLDGVRSGAELSHVETITVLVTDSLDATDNDTFDITWSVPTGVGTQTLYLTGTQAQINAMLATVEMTPADAFTGTIQCLMYSVTSTPLTDTDIFTITVAEPVGDVITLLVFPPSVKSSVTVNQVFIFTIYGAVLVSGSDAASIGAALTLGGTFTGLMVDQITKINNRQFSARLTGDLTGSSDFGSFILDESELDLL